MCGRLWIQPSASGVRPVIVDGLRSPIGILGSYGTPVGGREITFRFLRCRSYSEDPDSLDVVELLVRIDLLPQIGYADSDPVLVVVACGVISVAQVFIENLIEDVPASYYSSIRIHQRLKHFVLQRLQADYITSRRLVVLQSSASDRSEDEGAVPGRPPAAWHGYELSVRECLAPLLRLERL